MQLKNCEAIYYYGYVTEAREIDANIRKVDCKIRGGVYR